MERTSLRTMRDNINAIAIGKTGLHNDQHLKRKILEREFKATGNAAIGLALERQAKSAQQKKAAKRTNKTRSARRKDGTPQRKDFRTPDGFDECGAVTGRSYASQAAERAEKRQEGFPDVTRHTATINLMIEPLDGDMAVAVDLCRPRMRTAFSGLSDGSQISGAFQIAMETAEYLATIFPASELPACVDPVNRPDEIFALLHWHGVIADPHLSKQSVRQIIKDAFPGSRRVCVAKVQPERTNKHGEVTHGAQGYLEYAFLNKTEVRFKKTKQTKDAIIGHAMLAATWTRKNRSFSMGKSLDVTGVQVNPSRVMELEISDRLDHVKKNWDKLSYAEQFIHVWMSGGMKIVQKSRPWLVHGTSFRDQFCVFLSLVKKWSTDTSAEDACFYDYLDAPLE